MEKKLKHALILAAGKGKRLNMRNKPLAKVKQKPLICHIIDNLVNYGISIFYLVVFEEKDFLFLQLYYEKKGVIIRFILDGERRGSLWSFIQAENYISPPFVCADCDIIARDEDICSMLCEGFEKICTSNIDGIVARVIKPSKEDVNMLYINGTKAMGFNKEGSEEAVRGGYIYIWNYDEIFTEAKGFVEKQMYSFAEYIDYIFRIHNIGIMEIEDLWDIDTIQDIKYTEMH